MKSGGPTARTVPGPLCLGCPAPGPPGGEGGGGQRRAWGAAWAAAWLTEERLGQGPGRPSFLAGERKRPIFQVLMSGFPNCLIPKIS